MKSILDEIRSEIDERDTLSSSFIIGKMKVQRMADTIREAAKLPVPRDLFLHLIREGELVCLFGDSGVGKSHFAWQIATHIARTDNVLFYDGEMAEIQQRQRFTNKETGATFDAFPDKLFRCCIDPDELAADEMRDDYGDVVLRAIEQAALEIRADIVIIDNLTEVCNDTEKGSSAGAFMRKLMRLKKAYCWTVILIAHTPKRLRFNPMTANDLAGSKRLYNLFDTVVGLGQSAKDPNLKFAKQIKAPRTEPPTYDEDHVAVFELQQRDDGFMFFDYKGTAREADHLQVIDTDSRDATIIEMHEAGRSQREIAASMGCSVGTVNRIIKEGGLA